MVSQGISIPGLNGHSTPTEDSGKSRQMIQRKEGCPRDFLPAIISHQYFVPIIPKEMCYKVAGMKPRPVQIVF